MAEPLAPWVLLEDVDLPSCCICGDEGEFAEMEQDLAGNLLCKDCVSEQHAVLEADEELVLDMDRRAGGTF